MTLLLNILLALLLLLTYALLFIILMIGFLIALLKLYARFAKGVCKCSARLDGQTAIVTGANGGIGLETARELARRGARVLLACRDPERAETARHEIATSTGNRDVHYRSLDLSDLDSVRRFSARIAATERNLNILVLNAGAAGLMRRFNEEGIDPIILVNHLGHFLLTNLLLDKLASAAPSRVVVVSSIAHYFADLNPEALETARGGHWTRYANSKLCNILFARALSARVPTGIQVHSLHPGVVYTGIYRRIPDPWRSFLLYIVQTLFKTSVEGAQTSIHLCLAPDLGANGQYWMDCRPARSSAAARDPELSERVWRESARLTGLTGLTGLIDSPCESSPRGR